MRLFVLVTWLLASAHALAALEEDPRFVEAVGLYNDLEFDQAIFRFETLARDASRVEGDRARLFTWLGLTYAQVGDFESAQRVLETAVRFDIEVSAPAQSPPKVILLLDNARAAYRADLDKAAKARAKADAEALAKAESESNAKSKAEAEAEEKKPPAVVEEPVAGNAGVLFPSGVVATSLGLIAAGGATWFTIDLFAQLEKTGPDAFQDEAAIAKERAELDLALVYATGSVAVVLLAVGTTLLVLDE